MSGVGQRRGSKDASPVRSRADTAANPDTIQKLVTGQPTCAPSQGAASPPANAAAMPVNADRRRPVANAARAPRTKLISMRPKRPGGGMQA